MRVALAQINSTVGDLKGNADKIANFIIRACELKADIIAFPELAICGYPPEDLLLKEHFVRDGLKTLSSLVTKVSGITAIIGFVDRDNQGNLYNAAGIIKDRKLKGVYHKIDLPNYGVFDERRYFYPGKQASIVELGMVLFGVNICDDIWRAKGVAKLQADKGARLIINISASPYHMGKVKLRKDVLIERAKETKAYVCYNNLVGGQDELVFDGGSTIIGPQGKEIVCGEQFKEDLIIVDLPIKVKGKSKVKYKGFIRLGELKGAPRPALSWHQ